jgi:hypothetical protein
VPLSAAPWRSRRICATTRRTASGSTPSRRAWRTQKPRHNFGYGKALLVQLTPNAVEEYKVERLAQKASGATINRELNTLARMIARGRDLGHVTGMLRVRPHRMAESPARQGFFEPAQFQAVMVALPKHLRPVVAFGYETGWRLREITSRGWHTSTSRPASCDSSPARARTAALARSVALRSSWPFSERSAPRPSASGRAKR